MTTKWILLGAVLAVGCGKGEKGGGGGGATADTSAAVAAANAALPADLKGKLEFEGAKNDKEGVAIVAPKGWKAGMMPGSYQPPEDASLGFMTRYSVSSNCDGDCAPKDWKATADKVDFAQFKGDQFKIEKDENLPNGRVLVAKSGETTYVVAAWWKDGAKKYYNCRATLDREIAAAAPAFEAACRGTVVLGW
jgi:hypothetical protein